LLSETLDAAEAAGPFCATGSCLSTPGPAFLALSMLRDIRVSMMFDIVWVGRVTERRGTEDIMLRRDIA
jgi:hypothetical protein